MSVELSNWDAQVEGDYIQFQLKFRLTKDTCKPFILDPICNNNLSISVATTTPPPPKTASGVLAVCTPKGNGNPTSTRVVNQSDALSQYDLNSPKKPLKKPNTRNSVATYPLECSPDDRGPDLPARRRSESSSHFSHSTFHLTQQTPLSGPSGEERDDDEDEPVVVLWDSVRKHGQNQNNDTDDMDRRYFLAENSQLSSLNNQIALCSPGSAGQGGKRSSKFNGGDNQEAREVLVDKSTSTSEKGKPVLSKNITQIISLSPPGICRLNNISYKPELIEGMPIWTSLLRDRSCDELIECIPPPPFKDYWTAMYDMFPYGSEIWKSWDGQHYPPFGCHDLAVILENGASTAPKVAVFARSKTSRWKLSARHPIRSASLSESETESDTACKLMGKWILGNGWWLTCKGWPMINVIYLDIGFSPHGRIEQDYRGAVTLFNQIKANIYGEYDFRFVNFSTLRAYLERE